MIRTICRFFRNLTILMLVCAFALPAVSRAAAGDAAALVENIAREIDIRRQIQEKEDGWSDQKATLQEAYRKLDAERVAAQKNHDHLVRALAAKKAEFSQARRKALESQRVRLELQITLEAMVDRLKTFVRQDLVFLSQERRQRIESLETMLAGSKDSLAEKCRRVMEALQVETEYGQTMELREESIDLQGRPVVVETVRLGRLSLFFRTPDGTKVGHWDRADRAWRPLPPEYNRSINQVAEMALRQRPVEVIALPLGRIQAP